MKDKTENFDLGIRQSNQKLDKLSAVSKVVKLGSNDTILSRYLEGINFIIKVLSSSIMRLV